MVSGRRAKCRTAAVIAALAFALSTLAAAGPASPTAISAAAATASPTATSGPAAAAARAHPALALRVLDNSQRTILRRGKLRIKVRARSTGLIRLYAIVRGRGKAATA